jgi:hypothetical protein
MDAGILKLVREKRVSPEVALRFASNPDQMKKHLSLPPLDLNANELYFFRKFLKCNHFITLFVYNHLIRERWHFRPERR